MWLGSQGMRWLIIAGMIACSGGCAKNDSLPSPQLASKPCAKVAEGRMEDARVDGYTANAQIIAFRYSYNECVKWEDKGYEPGVP